jgi:hypothetical protein
MPSPALVISAIALVVAVGGGTFAIASSDNKKDKKIAKKVANKQIKKKAPNLKVKHAKNAAHAVNADNATHAVNADNATHAVNADNATNANHANSADTATNANTAANATGLNGPLASGKTLIGTFGTGGHKVNAGDFVDESPITFQIPLASAATFNDLAPGTSSTECPGSAATPAATGGNLCLYETIRTGATGVTDVGVPELKRFGEAIFPTGVAAGANYEVDGVWAVTAP